MKFFPKDKTALNGRVFRSGLYSAAITAAVGAAMEASY